MQICCTKKLFNETGIVPENGPEEIDLFCWSAHLITVKRRKTIVIVNDSNRFGFILHGLKAKDYKRLNELILEGIRTCLLDDKIKEELVTLYLQTAGELVFTKTRGPKYVARLNKACELVELFNDKLDPDELYQTAAAQMMNRDFIKVDKKSDREYIYDLLHKDFQQFAGEQIFRCEAVDLIVKLRLGSSTAWRRIITPSDITFKQLHAIIQVSFDWKDSHLYEFEIFDMAGRCLMNVISENEDVYESRQDCDISLDKDTKLWDFVQKDCKIVYRYDYGDNWEHEIINQGIIKDYDKNFPVCLLAEGNAPPEDVGGIPGYEEFLEIMADPEHEEYKNTLKWAKSQWYEDFDIDLVNRRLKNVLRYSL